MNDIAGHIVASVGPPPLLGWGNLVVAEYFAEKKNGFQEMKKIVLIKKIFNIIVFNCTN